MGQTFEQIVAIWKKLGVNQKVTVLFLAAAFVAALAALVHLSRRPSYELLYSGLDENDMARVASFLKESKVPFRITAGGKAIMVAEGKKYDMRLELADKGMLPGSGAGLEIYASSGWGTSQTAEQMLKRRAIQGELARTIMHIEQIEWANVQVAQPEPTVFVEDQKPTTAAISLQPRAGCTLTPTQVAGIRRLVAGSVEGLTADNVTVIDTRGNLLSSPGSDTVAAEASDAQDHRRAYEDYLAGKAQAMLDRALGPNRAIVKVSAVMDMNRKSETEESYDAEARVALKETMTSRTSTGAEGAAGSSEETSETAYTVPKKISTLETTPGAVKQLHVALIIDPHSTDAEGNEVELEQAKIAELAELVKSAVGFDATRNDTFPEPTTMRFHKPAEPTFDTEIEAREKKQFILQIAKYSSSVLAAVIFVIFAAVMLKRISRTVAAPGQGAAGGSSPLMIGGEMLTYGGGNGLSKIRNRVKETITGDPAAAARLLQQWIGQEKAK